MTDDQQMDELLIRAADDWVHAADVFDVARFSGATDESSYVEQAIHLASELLHRGLVVAGDLTESGFRSWSSGPAESADRIAERWREDHDAAPVTFFVWFEGTALGLERGRQVQRDRR
jgi:hypothetical protein